MYARIFSPFLLLSVLFLSSSCQEKKADFFERDAREYTEKYCPKQCDDVTRLDSIVFEKTGEMGTLKQYITLTLTKDEREKVMNQLDKLMDMNLRDVRNSVTLAKHKEVGVNFCYIYFDENTGDKIAEYTFTPEDYQ